MHPPAQADGTAWWSVAPYCRICGARPALQVTVHAHQGVLMWMRFHREDGPFCRSCGIAVVRELTTKTLWQGWWSPLSLVGFTPIALICNFSVRRKLTTLAPPGPSAPGATRKIQGKPVHQRPLAYVALVPLAWVVGFFIPQIIPAIITHI
ncbi:hypothetical protein AOB60_00510 [Streptomyces noursei]|uniref:Uncharacterized protein n=2 Tax=Streptomyces noursei TaxID=1971 RepID=A0A2N8PR36_STRNR|nr:hypothetical protein AOB60_00510 [Streptomyces noursei]